MKFSVCTPLICTKKRDFRAIIGSPVFFDFGYCLEIFSLAHKLLVEIDQIDLLGGSRQCRIEPAHQIARHRLVAKQHTVDKYRTPLSALRLVTRYGVGKFDLHGIIIW